MKAARDGRVEEVEEILRNNPILNVNCHADFNQTASTAMTRLSHSSWRIPALMSM